MSRLENEIKPLLTEMICGRDVGLSDEHKAMLTRYLMMKIFVCDAHNNADILFSMENRRHFFSDRVIPSGVEIALHKYKIDHDEVPQYYKDFVLHGRRDGSILYHCGFLLRIGNLLVQLRACSPPLPPIPTEKGYDSFELWPPNDEMLLWPPPLNLSKQRALFIQTGVGTLLAQVREISKGA